MEIDKRKYLLLDANGFASHFSRSIYFNKKKKIIVSLEAVEDHDFEWLEKLIAEKNETGNWQFHFENIASQELLREITQELEK